MKDETSFYPTTNTKQGFIRSGGGGGDITKRLRTPERKKLGNEHTKWSYAVYVAILAAQCTFNSVEEKYDFSNSGGDII